MDNKILYALLAVSMAGLIYSVTYTPPDEAWEEKTIAEDIDYRFFDVESSQGNIYMFYRNSSTGGVLMKKKPKPLLPSIIKSGWETIEITSEPGSGAQLSSEIIDGQPAVAYQDASLGSEKVVYSSKNNNWSLETISNVRQGGVNVGMYTSLTEYKDKPIVLYHSPEKGLIAAEKNDKGNWEKANLGDNQGWLIDTAKCEEEIYAAYTGRKTENLTISTYNGEWEKEQTGLKVKSAVAIDAPNCNKHLSYLKSSSESIKYRRENREAETLATGSDRSKISIESKEKGHNTTISYYNFGEGLYTAVKAGDSWDKTRIEHWNDTGMYNSLEILHSGDIFVGHTSNENLVRSRYMQGRTEILTQLKKTSMIATGTSSLIALVIILKARRKEN